MKHISDLFAWLDTVMFDSDSRRDMVLLSLVEFWFAYTFLLGSPNVFRDSPSYAAFPFPQAVYGWAFAFVFFLKVHALRTTSIRFKLLATLLATFLWVNMSVGYALSGVAPTAMFTYGCVAALSACFVIHFARLLKFRFGRRDKPVEGGGGANPNKDTVISP